MIFCQEETYIIFGKEKVQKVDRVLFVYVMTGKDFKSTRQLGQNQLFFCCCRANSSIIDRSFQGVLYFIFIFYSSNIQSQYKFCCQGYETSISLVVFYISLIQGKVQESKSQGGGSQRGDFLFFICFDKCYSKDSVLEQVVTPKPSTVF